MEKKSNRVSINKLPKGAIIGILILLPCIGFLLGMQYQKYVDGKVNLYPTVPVQPITPTAVPPESIIQSNNACQTDNDCTLYNPKMANNSTLCCHNQSMLCTKDQTQITALNKAYVQQQVKDLCKQNTVCPLFVAVCSQEIQQSISKLHAKCIQNTCQVKQTAQ